MRRVAIAVRALALLALLSACSGGGDGPVAPPVPATIGVAGLSTLAPGVTSPFVATARDASGAAMSNVSMTWSSSNVNVAFVSASGDVTAVSPGTTTISASGGGRTGSTALTVRYNIASVTLAGSGLLKVGDPYTYTATAKLSDGTVVSRPLEWAIVEAGRAVVTSAGVVTALQPGTFTVEVTIDGEKWTTGYSAYDWETFVSGGTSFLTLDADVPVTNRSGVSDRPELVVACGTGSFFLWVRTPHIITQSGSIAYLFDGGSAVSATWRELSPDYRTLWHPGTNASTKAFTALIASSRLFGFGFGEFQGSSKATIFRVSGMAPLVAPLFTLCPSSAITSGAPSDGVSVDQVSAEAKAMAAYLAGRGESSAAMADGEKSSPAALSAMAVDHSVLLTAWPVWSVAGSELRQAKRGQ